MELILMSLGGSLLLQLAEFFARRIVTTVHTILGMARRAGGRRQASRAGRRASLVVAATALLHALSPVRADGGELPARLGESSEAIAARAARAQEAETPAASLTPGPLVMRVGKDEFRLAFGITSVGCTMSGCHGVIRYRVNWKAEDGTTRSDLREVGYTVMPHDARSVTVDRQYFDTAEGGKACSGQLRYQTPRTTSPT